MKRFFVSGSKDHSVEEMFYHMGFSLITHLEDVEFDTLIVFTGGPDVNPELYGEINHSSSVSLDRDAEDIRNWNAIQDISPIPKMVGICRGGQFLNVMNGGKMIQDVDGHHMGYRSITSKLDGVEKEVIVHEDHHQAIVPHEEAEVIAVAQDGVVEVCFYHKTNSLCFQPHPEWGHEETEEYFFELLKKKGMI